MARMVSATWGGTSIGRSARGALGTRRSAAARMSGAGLRAGGAFAAAMRHLMAGMAVGFGVFGNRDGDGTAGDRFAARTVAVCGGFAGLILGHLFFFRKASAGNGWREDAFRRNGDCAI